LNSLLFYTKGFLYILILINLNCLEKSFLEKHWKFPIEEQGESPNGYSDVEVKLTPNDCGSCHPKQFDLWQKSLHRKSISEGLLWQLHGLGEKKSEACFSCHSPLKESNTILRIQEGWVKNYPKAWETYFPSDTKELGLSCATCHVRNHIRYGPPPRDKISQYSSNINTKKGLLLLPHNGAIFKKEFESSVFCKKCHESDDSVERINGKKMMETFSEWQDSIYSKEGIECQSCHMPNRNHIWAGISDAKMVRSGLKAELMVHNLEIGNSANRKENMIEILATLKSTYIGHKFPTYSVPKVYMNVYLVDKLLRKKRIGELTIGRFVDIHLTQEFYDTRLMPGETAKIALIIRKKELMLYDKILFEVDVDPSEMYIRMFEHNIQDQKVLKHSNSTIKKLEQSLNQKIKSKYNLYSKSLYLSESIF
jgi:hypothetical protein